VFFRVRNTAATRGQYLALSKAQKCCYILYILLYFILFYFNSPRAC